MTVLDPSAAVPARAEPRRSDQPDDVRQRVGLVRAAEEDAPEALGGETFDAAPCHRRAHAPAAAWLSADWLELPRESTGVEAVAAVQPEASLRDPQLQLGPRVPPRRVNAGRRYDRPAPRT